MFLNHLLLSECRYPVSSAAIWWIFFFCHWGCESHFCFCYSTWQRTTHVTSTSNKHRWSCCQKLCALWVLEGPCKCQEFSSQHLHDSLEPETVWLFNPSVKLWAGLSVSLFLFVFFSLLKVVWGMHTFFASARHQVNCTIFDGEQKKPGSYPPDNYILEGNSDIN